MRCEANPPWCLLLRLLGDDSAVPHNSMPHPQGANRYQDIRPRDYYENDSSIHVWVIIVILVVGIKLVIAAILISRCVKRRNRKERRERELQQQTTSFLPPPPAYGVPSAGTVSKSVVECTEPHYPGGHCQRCGTGITTEAGITAAVTTVASQASSCTRQHVADIPCPECGGTSASDRMKIAPEASATKRKRDDKPKCRNIHLPWRKCPTCHVDPPRNGHIELASDPLPLGPHEMHAHVPAWQGEPRLRTENYGGFYGPEPQRSGRAANQGQRPYADLPRHQTTATLMTPPPAATAATASTSMPHTMVVGDGHKSYVSYQAASGRDLHHHTRTRSVSPIGDERTPMNDETNATNDLESGTGERHKRNKSGDGFMSRFLGT